MDTVARPRYLACIKPKLQEKEVDPIEMVEYSVFPKLVPPRESCEPNSTIFIVQATPHPAFIPFQKPTFLAYGKEIQHQLQTMEETMYKPTLLVAELGKIEKVRDEV